MFLQLRRQNQTARGDFYVLKMFLQLRQNQTARGDFCVLKMFLQLRRQNQTVRADGMFLELLRRNLTVRANLAELIEI